MRDFFFHTLKREAPGPLRKDLGQGVLAALIVTAGLLFINGNRRPDPRIVVAALFCFVLYSVFFTVGARTVSTWLRTRLEGARGRFLIPPLLLAGLLYAYLFAVRGHPSHWPKTNLRTAWMYLAAVPLLAVLPSLLFLPWAKETEKPVGVRDFLFFGVSVGALGWFRFPFDAIPVTGRHFETASRLTLLLALVYSAVVVRRLKRVGFTLSFRGKDLGLTLGCWLIMLVLFAGLLYPAGRLEFTGYGTLSLRGFRSGLRVFLFHLFCVGAFEEFVFRGLFQNMLAQATERLGDATRKKLLAGVAVFLVAAALAVTFLIPNPSFRWLAPGVVLLIFAGTHRVEKRIRIRKGEYMVLAIISAVFGIVHFRFGVVFMAMACLAGWFNGFVYTKTKNVFLAAFLHALLNCSPMFFGLQVGF